MKLVFQLLTKHTKAWRLLPHRMGPTVDEARGNGYTGWPMPEPESWASVC